MRVESEPAYLLHRRRYRETSSLLDALTPDHGRIALVQRGSGKNTGNPQPFMPLRLSFTGKGELFTLTGSEAAGLPLYNSTAQRLRGLYVNELVMRLIPKLSPSAELYILYEEALAGLRHETGIEPMLRQFECSLLEMTGCGLQLGTTADTEADVQADNQYRYELGRGPVQVNNAVTGWNVVVGRTLLALQAPEQLDDSTLAEAKRLLRGIIDYHLRGRPLMTRQILQYMAS